MIHKRTQDIRHAQRESALYTNIAQFFMQITMDNPSLSSLFVTRVTLSSDRSMCNIFVYTAGGLQDFEKLRKELVLFKSSLRTALAKSIAGRYTPDLRFVYDSQLEKQEYINNLIERLKDKELDAEIDTETNSEIETGIE